MSERDDASGVGGGAGRGARLPRARAVRGAGGLIPG